MPIYFITMFLDRDIFRPQWANVWSTNIIALKYPRIRSSPIRSSFFELNKHASAWSPVLIVQMPRSRISIAPGVIRRKAMAVHFAPIRPGYIAVDSNGSRAIAKIKARICIVRPIIRKKRKKTRKRTAMRWTTWPNRLLMDLKNQMVVVEARLVVVQIKLYHWMVVNLDRALRVQRMRRKRMRRVIPVTGTCWWWRSCYQCFSLAAGCYMPITIPIRHRDNCWFGIVHLDGVFQAAMSGTVPRCICEGTFFVGIEGTIDMGKRGGQLFSCRGNEIWLRFYAFELTLFFSDQICPIFLYTTKSVAFPPFGSFKCPFSHKKTLPSCYFFSFARVALFLLTVFMVMVMVMYVFHFIVVASQALSRFFVFFLKRKKIFFVF